jgi:hypothetical protein
MYRRYLLDDPQFFSLVWRQWRNRPHPATTTTPNLETSVTTNRGAATEEAHAF